MMIERTADAVYIRNLECHVTAFNQSGGGSKYGFGGLTEASLSNTDKLTTLDTGSHG